MVKRIALNHFPPDCLTKSAVQQFMNCLDHIGCDQLFLFGFLGLMHLFRFQKRLVIVFDPTGRNILYFHLTDIRDNIVFDHTFIGSVITV